MNGRLTQFCALLACLFLLAGCGPRATGPAPGGTTVGLVLDTGGPDDHSFNAAAVAGLNRATQQLGVAGKYVESNSTADYKTNLTQLAQQHDSVVFAIGYKMASALQDVASRFPDVKFAIVDSDAPNLPNCAGLVFKEQEGSFLAGFLAASVSRTKHIGFVGGEKIPLIEKFQAGYTAGARMADASVVVTASYTGDWNDESKGRNQAAMQFGNGDDIIYHAAGKAGLGVIEEAKARGPGYYAIGVDQDQDWLAPGRVLTSMVKHVDTAVFNTIQDVKEGKFQPGTHVFGLKDDGVGLSAMKYTRSDVPPAVLAQLDRVKQLIIQGKLTPPATMEEAAAFRPPKL